MRLLEIIAAHGVKTLFCSPGSRNAPLIREAAARTDMLKYVVVDERVAAFMALGHAIVSRRPTALLCTSGTALLNYAPAVAEAFYQGIPLIVISADRPKEWIDQDDSQTIRQPDALRNFVKQSFDIPLLPSGSASEGGKDFRWYCNRIANEGMLTALRPKPGPVHFNVRIPDPSAAAADPECIHAPAHEPARVIIPFGPEQRLPRTDAERLAAEMRGRRVMIVAGFHQSDNRLNRAVAEMLAFPGVTLLAESISNLHVRREYFIIDPLLGRLNAADREELRPDIVISLGGALVSRMLKDYLRRYPPQMHWALGHTNFLADCFQTLTHKIEIEPAAALHQLASAMRRHRDLPAESYGSLWSRMRRKALEQFEAVVRAPGWTDLKAHEILAESIPEDYNLFLSNGTPIRYAQLFADGRQHATYCNRGVSGIDGSTSTAIGGALAYKRPTLLISGDMSASYDLGAFGTRLAPPRFKLVVINNGGGAIFRFIRSTRDLDCRERYFCADPQLPLRELAQAYGWIYLRADSDESLRRMIPQLLGDTDAPTVLEIVTPHDDSPAKRLGEALTLSVQPPGE